MPGNCKSGVVSVTSRLCIQFGVWSGSEWHEHAHPPVEFELVHGDALGQHNFLGFLGLRDLRGFRGFLGFGYNDVDVLRCLGRGFGFGVGVSMYIAVAVVATVATAVACAVACATVATAVVCLVTAVWASGSFGGSSAHIQSATLVEVMALWFINEVKDGIFFRS
jgi:hypothetical protein